jgi:hypothetical protein
MYKRNLLTLCETNSGASISLLRNYIPLVDPVSPVEERNVMDMGRCNILMRIIYHIIILNILSRSNSLTN